MDPPCVRVWVPGSSQRCVPRGRPRTVELPQNRAGTERRIYSRSAPRRWANRMFFDPLYIVESCCHAWPSPAGRRGECSSTYAKWSKVDSGINARRLRLRTPAPRSPGPARRQDRADAGPADRPLRPARQGAARQHPGGRRLGARPPPASVTSGPRLSVAAAAVIAHEVGHALQDHAGDPAMKLRQAIVPAAQFGSGIAPWLIIAGSVHPDHGARHRRPHRLRRRRRSSPSPRCRSRSARRARRSPSSTASAWSARRQTGAREVLKAAAWTYVAGALDGAADLPVLRVADLRTA